MSSSQLSPCVLRTRRWYSVFLLEAAIRPRVLFPGRRKGSETSLSRLLRTARRGSQVPVRLLLVDGHGKQPRVRQQAATVVRAFTRQTGRSLAKRRDGETHVQLSRHGGIHRVRQEVLQNSRAATRSINILALVSYIRVLISRTCNHLSFPKGTPRCHRSLPWALHVPSDHHAAAKLSLC